VSLFTREGPVRDDSADERTVRLARRRFTRRQWARRWLAWRRVLVALLLLGAMVGALALVFFSSALAVSGVRVDGVQVLDPRVVRRTAAVPVGSPLATVDLGAIAARVENLPAVKRVDVSRAWPDRVRIAVVEREAVAVVQRDGVLRGLDAEGVMFRRYPSRPASLPVIRMGRTTGADALAEAARVAGVLPPSLLRRVEFVEVHTVDTIALRLRNGDTVRWGSADDAQAKAKVLQVLLHQKATMYDVSVPTQPVLKR